MRLIFLVVPVLVLLHKGYSLSAQSVQIYAAKPTYNSTDTQLMDRLAIHIGSEGQGEPGYKSEAVKNINVVRLKFLKSLVTSEMIIRDDRFESSVNNIVNRIVA